MSEKVNFPGLVNLLALQSGDTKKQSEDLIRELFAVISEALVDGEQIKIKDIGVFKTVAVEARKSVNVSTGEDNKIPAHRKVVFVPSKEIAAIVNAPFEMFETVILDDNDLVDEDSSADDDDVQVDSDTESEVETETEATTEYGRIEDDGVNCEKVTEDDSELDNRTQNEMSGEAADDTYVMPEALHNSQGGNQPNNESFLAEDKDGEEDIDGEDSISEDTNLTGDTHLTEEGTVAAPTDLYQNFNDTTIEANNASPKRKFWIGFMTGFVSALAIAVISWCAVLYVDWDCLLNRKISTQTINKTTEEPQEKAVHLNTTASAEDAEVKAEDAEVKAEDTEEKTEPESKHQRESGDIKPTKEEQIDVPTQPSDAKIYDTITKTRYLTTMAKEHYGNFHFWPYIYMENASFLGHPDRIKPGTQVVVPPLSKYGVSTSNPADVAQAKREGIKIYARYKSK